MTLLWLLVLIGASLAGREVGLLWWLLLPLAWGDLDIMLVRREIGQLAALTAAAVRLVFGSKERSE